MLRRLLNIFRPNYLEDDLREEIEFHRSKSKGDFGNSTLILDQMRDASTVNWLQPFWQDVRYGLRQLSKSPILLTVAVLSLALGIGANTAIFTLINAISLQLLPVQDPAHLILFNDATSEGTGRGDLVGDELSYPFYRDLRSNNSSFAKLCAFRLGEDEVILHIQGDAAFRTDYASAHLVSGNYFSVLGVRAAVGRLLLESDDAPSATPTLVMSYGIWNNRFGRDPKIVGKTISLNGFAYSIAGVADSSFFGERIRKSPDFWVPLAFQAQIMKNERSMLGEQNTFWLNCIGRLKTGVSLAAAEQEVNARLHTFYLEHAGAHPSTETRHKIERVSIHLKPGGGGISGLRYRYSKPLFILMAIVALILLIACANIATLLLARSSARRPEFLCRLALGASRFRLIRQVLTESFLLALFGGLAGLLFSFWWTRGLVVLLRLDPVVDVRPDSLVLVFSILISLLSGIFFGVIPAWIFSRMEPRASNSSIKRWRSRQPSSTKMLIVLQVALSLCVLVAAGLLTRSFLALEHQNAGFSRNRVLLIRTDTDLAGYQESKLAALYRDLDERTTELPGVQSASLGRFSPVSGYSAAANFSIEDDHISENKQKDVWYLSISPRFFETLQIPRILGRSFMQRDNRSSTPVVIVNQKFVDEYFPNVNPLGQHVSLGSPFKAPGSEIVGVVGDSKFFDLRESPKPMAFFPIYQEEATSFELVVRTAGEPTNLSGEMRSLLKQVDKRLPILDEHTLAEQIESSLTQEKLITTLCGIFGMVALILAAIGIYGTLSYAVAGRTAEIGTRMAIGAQKSDVIGMVLRDLTFVLTAGLGFGLLGAIVASRGLESFLFGVRPFDAPAILFAVLLLLTVALFAGYLPARKAANIDPMRALRQE
jgi:predicted permease